MNTVSSFPEELGKLFHIMNVDLVARMAEIDKSLQEQQATRETLRERIVAQKRELDSLIWLENQTTERIQKIESKIAEELYLLRGLPHVVEVETDNGVFHVYTDEIEGWNGATQQSHLLGTFRLDLFPLAQSTQDIVRVFNLQSVPRFGDSFIAAPNFKADGTPRFQLSSELTEDIANFHLSRAASKLLGLLLDGNSLECWAEAIKVFPKVHAKSEENAQG